MVALLEAILLSAERIQIICSQALPSPLLHLLLMGQLATLMPSFDPLDGSYTYHVIATAAELAVVRAVTLVCLTLTCR